MGLPTRPEADTVKVYQPSSGASHSSDLSRP